MSRYTPTECLLTQSEGIRSWMQIGSQGRKLDTYYLYDPMVSTVASLRLLPLFICSLIVFLDPKEDYIMQMRLLAYFLILSHKAILFIIIR